MGRAYFRAADAPPFQTNSLYHPRAADSSAGKKTPPAKTGWKNRINSRRIPNVEIDKTASILYTIGWNMGTGCHAFFLRPSPVRFPHAPAAPGPKKSTRPFRVCPNPEERKDDPT